MRRKERKQFKVDRAQAILDASLAAEAILSGRSAVPSAPTGTGSESATRLDAVEVDSTKESQLGRHRAFARTAVVTSTNTAVIPELDEYAHVLPETEARLTPQTFLVRPARPDQRVKAPRPAPPLPASASATPSGAPNGAAAGDVAHVEKSMAGEELPEVVDAEHLQLNMEEAIFLSWAIGCLNIIDSRTVSNPIARCKPLPLKQDLVRKDFPWFGITIHALFVQLCRSHQNSRHYACSPGSPLITFLCGVSPLSLLRLGRKDRHKVLYRLAALQARNGLQSRRVSLICALMRWHD